MRYLAILALMASTLNLSAVEVLADPTAARRHEPPRWTRHAVQRGRDLSQRQRRKRARWVGDGR